MIVVAPVRSCTDSFVVLWGANSLRRLSCRFFYFSVRMIRMSSCNRKDVEPSGCSTPNPQTHSSERTRHIRAEELRRIWFTRWSIEVVSEADLCYSKLMRCGSFLGSRPSRPSIALQVALTCSSSCRSECREHEGHVCRVLPGAGTRYQVLTARCCCVGQSCCFSVLGLWYHCLIAWGVARDDSDEVKVVRKGEVDHEAMLMGDATVTNIVIAIVAASFQETCLLVKGGGPASRNHVEALSPKLSVSKNGATQVSAAAAEVRNPG